jgi:hypothetical protein
MFEKTLCILCSVTTAKKSTSPIGTGDFRIGQRLFSLPGLTEPVLLVVSPRTKAARKNNVCLDILRLAADVLHLRAWRDMDPLACFLLAAFTAVIAQPVVFGNLGNSIHALMTPVK